MANCKECLHYKVCAREGRIVQIDEHTWGEYNQLDAVEVFCGEYMSADVVPKSEVDRLQAEIKVLTENSITSKYPCCVSCSKGLILTKSLEEYDKLLADIATEVAREIFEEIEREIETQDSLLVEENLIYLPAKIAELKNKYTEGK